MANFIYGNLHYQLERGTNNIFESIAKDGLKILIRVLEKEGFSQNEYLKNYEAYAKIKDGVIYYEIDLDFESFDEETQKELLEIENDQNAQDETDDAGTKVFGRNQYGNVGRLLNYRDSRVDARSRARNALVPKAVPAKEIRTSIIRNEDNRKLRHTIAAKAPRSALVSVQSKKVSLRMKTMVRNRNEDVENQEFVYKNKKFEGIVGRFLSELTTKVAEVFSQELKVMMRKMS